MYYDGFRICNIPCLCKSYKNMPVSFGWKLALIFWEVRVFVFCCCCCFFLARRVVWGTHVPKLAAPLPFGMYSWRRANSHNPNFSCHLPHEVITTWHLNLQGLLWGHLTGLFRWETFSDDKVRGIGCLWWAWNPGLGFFHTHTPQPFPGYFKRLTGGNAR